MYIFDIYIICICEIKMSATIECYTCHQHVADLKVHRTTCQRSVKCFDCHHYVTDLKSHRTACPNSRYAKSIVVPSERKSVASVKTSAHTDYYFLLDVSGSMSMGRLDRAKETLLEVVGTLDPKDRLAIISFDTKAFFKLHPRPIEQILRQGELPGILKRIFAQGGTALYDAIHLAVTQIRTKDQTVVINVLTDGEDNASTHKLAEVQALVEAHPNVKLNIVHIGSRTYDIYAQLCDTRGKYALIADAEIKSELTKIFRPEDEVEV